MAWRRSLWFLVALQGCYSGLEGGPSPAGGIDATGHADGSGSDDGSDADEPSSHCDTPSPGASPIRRLTAWEFNNTVRDLLGDDSRPADSFPLEGGSGFDNNADVGTVTRLMAEKYMTASEDISARAVADLPGLLGCEPIAGSEACVRSWIERFGRRAWRRPLSAAQREAMETLYDETLASSDAAQAVAAVLQAFLQSPHFLYRAELGVDASPAQDAVALDAWELASRLSYLMWGSMPDDELLEAAEQGRLSTAEEIESQARRMLEDPRARAMVNHFFEQWLGYTRLTSLDKDPATFPAWSGAVAAAQREEIERFIDHVVFESDARLSTLLTAPYTFVDSTLAQFYGLPSPGEGMVLVEPTDRDVAGILTMGGVLAAHDKPDASNPIGRGLFVREQLLCTIAPPPPDDVDTTLPDLDPDATERERLEEHSANPACRGCHDLFDPIGFGFEHYDGVGRWRTTAAGKPIDASGELTGADVTGEFTGAVELASMLAQSDDVARCVTRQWFRFAYARAESEADACTLDLVAEHFAASGGDVRELLVDLTQTDAFRFRTPYQPGGQ